MEDSSTREMQRLASLSSIAAKTLFSFETKLSPDTVEWCPHSGFENILVVGSYQVNKSDNEVFDDTQRYGRIYVFQCENSTFKVCFLQILCETYIFSRWTF